DGEVRGLHASDGATDEFGRHSESDAGGRGWGAAPLCHPCACHSAGGQERGARRSSAVDAWLLRNGHSPYGILSVAHADCLCVERRVAGLQFGTLVCDRGPRLPTCAGLRRWRAAVLAGGGRAPRNDRDSAALYLPWGP